jgi:hypothetical protein
VLTAAIASLRPSIIRGGAARGTLAGATCRGASEVGGSLWSGSTALFTVGGEEDPSPPSSAEAPSSSGFFFALLLLFFLGAARAGKIEERRVTKSPPVRLELLEGTWLKVNLIPFFFLNPRLNLIGG